MAQEQQQKQQQQQQQQQQPLANAPRQRNRKRCAFFHSPQGCRRGDECMFAHTPTSSPSSSSPLPGAHPRRGTGRPKNARERASRPTPVGQDASIPSTHHISASHPTPVASAVAADAIKPLTEKPPRQPRPPQPLNPSRAPVRKPLPKSLNTKGSLTLEEQHKRLRDYELSQVKSRFGSSASFKDLTAPSALETVWGFGVTPTDPDFPYEIDSLEIKLHVPMTYPREPAWLVVLNSNIPLGFARNLEKGFDEHAKLALSAAKSLLAQLSWLDINMERLLQQPPTPTIRFISHASTSPKSSNTASPIAADSVQEPTPHKVQPSLPPPSQPRALRHPSWTTQERQEASVKRQQQIAQLNARFRGSITVHSPSSIEIALEPTQRAQLPLQWQGPLKIHILIPTLYPLEPCSIQLGFNGANPEFEEWRSNNIEKGFDKIVASAPPQAQSLFQYLNQFNRDLKSLMLLPEPPSSTDTPTLSEPMARLQLQEEKEGAEVSTLLAKPSSLSTRLQESMASSRVPTTLNGPNPGRRLYHVEVPASRNFVPEHEDDAYTSEDTNDSLVEDGDDGETDDEEANGNETQHSIDNDDSDGDCDNGSGEASASSTPATKSDTVVSPKRGVEIRMPGIVLDHISLLQCSLLNLLVRCNRCKALIDIPNLKPDSEQDQYSAPSGGGESSPKGVPSSAIDRRKAFEDKQTWKNCDNCLSPLGAHFRPDFIHVQSRTLGFLDLAGCTAYDLLPSTYIPTCDGCDQVLGSGSSGGAIGFRQQVGRGMSASANCRSCHQRLVFGLEGEVRFIKLAPGDLLQVASQTLEQLPKKKKGKGGSLATMYEEAIKVGESLPRKGACEHYKKSRRWFRFPCCSKIYPCHLCHDEKETDHEAEYAKRMICGHCAREQPVSDKPCQCGHSPVKSSKSNSAFWEGGEGVRDKTRMSTKDSRKYKGSSKTVAKKQVGTENALKREQKTKK
ncbi:hypothetical protein DFQ26_008976 [Actinomortierella ambigua]|nr:hypothetical protein DFQ26_008976 [Actinomortierella ambigua]